MQVVAYLVNQYPKVSHSFIRREILALERQGVRIVRMAIRGWDLPLADEEDQRERTKTAYLLRGGVAGLLPAVLRLTLRSPRVMLRCARVALSMARMSERPSAYHLVYLAEACKVVELAGRHEVTHLHAHFGTNSAEVAMFSRMLGGPSYSFTVHGPAEFDRPLSLHLKEKIATAAFVVGISSFGRAQLYRWIPHSEWRKVHVVHCGLDHGFTSAPVSPPDPAPRVVCIGRLTEQKGQALLLEAVRAVIDAGTDVEVVFAGDGELRPALEALVERYGLQGKVRITGWISGDQVRNELVRARALVLPSFAEGLPVAVMEAMAMGRPVLTTSIAGIPELVRHGKDGWLFPAGDVDAVKGALLEVLSASPERLSEMGQAARQRVLERHSVDDSARQLRSLFQSQSGTYAGSLG
jgi:colanic acid/amylovoran biosynthesis glycosyltransferase